MLFSLKFTILHATLCQVYSMLTKIFLLNGFELVVAHDSKHSNVGTLCRPVFYMILGLFSILYQYSIIEALVHVLSAI